MHTNCYCTLLSYSHKYTVTTQSHLTLSFLSNLGEARGEARGEAFGDGRSFFTF